MHEQRADAAPRSERRVAGIRITIAIVIVILLVAIYFLLSTTGILEQWLNGPALRRRIVELGPLGPFLIIALMAGAIVINPIPSAPIALASGAVYGHTFGTIYVVAGAEIGALIAFGIARLLGCDLLPRLCRSRDSLKLLGSQNMLTGIVFVSRLLPFVSFDLVSYAAGLTALSTWRFALATLAGILPASFLLAHFGAEMASADTQRILISVVALGTLTLIPIAINVLLSKRRKAAAQEKSS